MLYTVQMELLPTRPRQKELAVPRCREMGYIFPLLPSKGSNCKRNYKKDCGLSVRCTALGLVLVLLQLPWALYPIREQRDGKGSKRMMQLGGKEL